MCLSLPKRGSTTFFSFRVSTRVFRQGDVVPWRVTATRSAEHWEKAACLCRLSVCRREPGFSERMTWPRGSGIESLRTSPGRRSGSVQRGKGTRGNSSVQAGRRTREEPVGGLREHLGWMASSFASVVDRLALAFVKRRERRRTQEREGMRSRNPDAAGLGGGRKDASHRNHGKGP